MFAGPATFSEDPKQTKPEQHGRERLLLVSSWDMSVNLYDVEGNKKLVTYKHECPILDVCFLQNEEYCCSVGSDGHIILKNISVDRRFPLQPIGKHDLGVRKCIFNRDKNMLMTGSWDTTVKIFDPRQGPESHSKGRLECSELRSVQHSGKIFSMCNLGADRFLTAASKQEIYTWDPRNLSKPEFKRRSVIQNQIREVTAFPNGSGYITAHAEGRVSVEYLDAQANVNDKFAFKCHREKDENGVDIVYPVNTITMHPRCKTFATGGADGVVNVWDPVAKKRVTQLAQLPLGVTSINYNSSGKYIAIACSYNYEHEEDPIEVPSDRIYIRQIKPNEVMPKKY